MGNEQTKNKLNENGRWREKEVERLKEGARVEVARDHSNIAVWPGHTDYSHVQSYHDWHEAEDNNNCSINCSIRFNNMRDMNSILQSVAVMFAGGHRK